MNKYLTITDDLIEKYYRFTIDDDKEETEIIYKRNNDEFRVIITKTGLHGSEGEILYNLELLKNNHHVYAQITYNCEKLCNIDNEGVVNVLRQIKDGKIDDEPNAELK